MNRLVVVGGFTEGKKPLESIAEAACEIGIAQDADVFVFRDVVEGSWSLHRAANKANVLTHSAGILALHGYMKPQSVTAYNGPELSSKAGLVRAATVKTFRHQKGIVTGPDRAGHARALGSNTAELVRHPWANLKHVGAIAAFSALKHLSDIHTSGDTKAAAVIMNHDEFFQVDEQLHNDSVQAGVHVTRLDGYHDDLLVNPKSVLLASRL